MTRILQDRAARTRAALLEAARGIAEEAGLAALRMEAVVRRAGTAKGTVFAHFPDKEHLIAALVAERISAIATPAPAASVQDVLAACQPLLDFMVAEPEILPVMARFSVPQGKDPGLGLAIHDQIARIAAAIAEAQASPGAGLRRADPGMLAEGMIAFLFHAAATALCVTGQEDGHQSTADRAKAQLARMAALWLCD